MNSRSFLTGVGYYDDYVSLLFLQYRSCCNLVTV